MTVQIVGDVSRDSSNDPIGSVYTPETPNKDLTPMQGGPRKADSQGVTSAPAAISGSFVELAGLTAGALNADLIPSTDVSAYKSVSLQITGTWVGALSIQGSNDNATWQSVNSFSMTFSFLSNVFVNNDFILIPVSFRYLRVRMTSYTSGTANGIVELYTIPHPFFLFAAQLGIWTVQPGNTQNTTPWLTQGPTTKGTQVANTAANTVIKASAGALWSAVVTTLGTAQLDIFDNASTNAGTKLLSIPASAPVGSIYNFPGGMPAANGIISAGVLNCPAVTFAYR